MGILYNSNIQLFLPANGKAKMGAGICAYTGSTAYGNISVAAFCKRPVRSNGYYRFNRFLAAGFILYKDQRRKRTAFSNSKY